MEKLIKDVLMSGSQLWAMGSVLPGTPMKLCTMCLRIVTLKHGRWRHLSTNCHLFLVEVVAGTLTSQTSGWYLCKWINELGLCREPPLPPANQMERHSMVSRGETSSVLASWPPPWPEIQAGWGRRD